MDEYLKTACQHCGGHLEFPADAAGAKVPCPHCHAETVLNPLAEPSTPEFPDEEKLLARIQRSSQEGDDPLQRSVKKVAILAGILVLLLVALAVAAAWLSHLKKRPPVSRPAPAQIKQEQ